MTVEEFRSAGRELYGHGWQTRMSEELAADVSSVRRWSSGATPVPGPVAAALRCFLQRKRLLENIAKP
jgi:hypothetical protein